MISMSTFTQDRFIGPQPQEATEVLTIIVIKLLAKDTIAQLI